MVDRLGADHQTEWALPIGYKIATFLSSNLESAAANPFSLDLVHWALITILYFDAAEGVHVKMR